VAPCIIQFFSCNHDEPSHKNKDIQEGFNLAKKHCTTCHLFPKPDLLNKATWAQHVLPKMGELLGFRRFASDYIEYDTALNISIDQWRNIVRYYTSEAPESPVERKEQVRTIKPDLPNFTVEIPETRTADPSTTMVKIDELKKEVLFADGKSGNLYRLKENHALIDSMNIGIGMSSYHSHDSAYNALTMGVLHPSDVRSGRLTAVPHKGKRRISLIDSLQRPVHAAYSDINNDGQEDVIICEFGNTTGQLSWFENKNKGNFDKHILRAFPGSVKSEIYDFNKDGKPDIIALMAQGDEGFFIYYNQGNGTFKEQRILRFNPSFGSNYFELADFNKDGFPDILMSNGDNGDYPPILKAYHGIRIYMNNGKNEFIEKQFLAVNGVGKVIARDFDSDGDLDLASISYFPDYKKTPEESFIYWKNGNDLNFLAYSFSEVTIGRWLTMDANDADGDGDIDIVLGNAKFTLGTVPPELMEKWDSYSPSILLLRNTFHK
jgi:hypothetical protein